MNNILFEQLIPKDTDKKIYHVLQSSEKTQAYSWNEIAKQAIGYGNYLIQEGFNNKPVILLLPQGIELLTAILSCFYAGAIAVPLNYPVINSNSVFTTLQNIIADAQADLILTNAHMIENIQYKNLSLSPMLDIFSITQSELTDYNPASYHKNQSICLLYTSGSIASPKGSILTFDNLISSMTKTKERWHVNEDAIFVSWAPPAHVFGMTTGLLLPLFSQAVNYNLTARQVIENPLYWLQTISKYRATHSGAPNFAYELCANLPSA